MPGSATGARACSGWSFTDCGQTARAADAMVPHPPPAPTARAGGQYVPIPGTLLARQWAKHGACMARKPATYFKVMRIPGKGYAFDYDRVSREDRLTAGAIRTRFVDAITGGRAKR